MVAWVVINRQHLPRAARGPSQPRKSRPIRALSLAARLFNNPTFKPANDPQFPPASIPILELTPPSSHRKSPPSFHALTWNPFFNPFVFIFMHVMGGYESVWQLQVVAINCARPTTLSQYVVVATNKNRVPTQTRTPSSGLQPPIPYSQSPIPFLFKYVRILLHFFALFCTFLHSPKTQLFYFQSIAHSLQKHPGVWGTATAARSAEREAPC